MSKYATITGEESNSHKFSLGDDGKRLDYHVIKVMCEFEYRLP